MKYQGFLRLYKACLRMYPATFRQRYAEQMYLTAADMLRDAQGTDGLTRAARLTGDAGLGLVREHSKQAGGAGMQKRSKTTWASAGRAMLIGLEIVAVPVLTFISVEPLMNGWSTLGSQTLPSLIDNLVMHLLPVILASMSFYLSGRVRIGLGHRIVSSLLIGCMATFAFYWFGSTIYIRIWQAWPILQGQLSFLYDLVCVTAYLAAFYALGIRVTRRITIKPELAE